MNLKPLLLLALFLVPTICSTIEPRRSQVLTGASYFIQNPNYIPSAYHNPIFYTGAPYGRYYDSQGNELAVEQDAPHEDGPQYVLDPKAPKPRISWCRILRDKWQCLLEFGNDKHPVRTFYYDPKNNRFLHINSTNYNKPTPVPKDGGIKALAQYLGLDFEKWNGVILEPNQPLPIPEEEPEEQTRPQHWFIRLLNGCALS